MALRALDVRKTPRISTAGTYGPENCNDYAHTANSEELSSLTFFTDLISDDGTVIWGLRFVTGSVVEDIFSGTAKAGAACCR